VDWLFANCKEPVERRAVAEPETPQQRIDRVALTADHILARLQRLEGELAKIKGRSKAVMETSCAVMLSERRYWPQEDGEAYVKAAIARSRTVMPKCVEAALAEINRRLDELTANRSESELDQESRFTRKTTKCLDDHQTLKTAVQASGTLLVDLNAKYDTLYELVSDCEKDIINLTSKLGLDLCRKVWCTVRRGGEAHAVTRSDRRPERTARETGGGQVARRGDDSVSEDAK